MTSTPAPPIDYVKRVNRALDHIVRNLERPLPLDEVAQVGGFSPFHFHRIFRALMGETLNDFTKRLRLERAMTMLSHHRPKSLTEVALASGFSSSSDFSRSFKQRYGIPPSAIDIQKFRDERRGGWGFHLDRLPPGENPDNFEVELRELPARHVAYIRVLDPFRPHVVKDAVDRLVAWAKARGLEGGQWLGYMWEDPEIVAHADCRYDAGLEVPAGVEPTGEVGLQEFAPMLVAQVEVRGDIQLEQRALDWLYGTWLPNSPYVPADQPAFEAWIGMPFAHGIEHFELYAQIPVERLRQ